jgi:dipeptidyl aminopeptidase/acylaminoacyl peptidase
MRTLSRLALAALCAARAAAAPEVDAVPTRAAPPAARASEPAPEPKPREPLTLIDFAHHPYATLPTLSPDGTQIAIIYRTDDAKERAIAVRSTALNDASPPRVLGSIRSRPRWLHWSKNDRILLSAERFQTRTEIGSLERPVEPPRPIYDRRGNIVGYQIPPIPPRKEFPPGRVVFLYGFNPERGSSRHLGKRWEDPVPIQDDVLSWLPTDPKRILISYDPVERFSSQRETRPSARTMSVATGGLRLVAPAHRHVQRWFADHDGQVVLGEGELGNGEVALFRRDGRKLVEISTYVSALEATARFAAHSYDPDLIYVWAPVQGRQALLALRLSDGSFEGVFAHPRYDVSGPLVFDEAQRKLVGVGYVDDAPRLHALDESLAKERELMEKAVPGVVLEYVSESADRKLVLVRSSSDLRPPAYYLYDRTKHEMRLELVEHPRLEDEAFQPMEPVRYFARDGLEIPAYLTRPPGNPAKSPAIVLVHDGPDERAMRRFDPLVQWLARRGFAVLEPNYRGSTGYGAKLRSAGAGEWGKAMQDDLEDAAAWLVSEGIADARRIGIYGRGYGGYAALMALVRPNTPFRAAASHGGPTDLVQLLEDDERERVEPDWSRRVKGARKVKDAELEALSPITHVARLAGPVLLLHSEEDERVRIEHAKELEKAAKKAGKRVELVEFDDELHELAKEENRVLWFEKLTAFFERSLAAPPAAEAAAPAAPESAPASLDEGGAS